MTTKQDIILLALLLLTMGGMLEMGSCCGASDILKPISETEIKDEALPANYTLQKPLQTRKNLAALFTPSVYNTPKIITNRHTLRTLSIWFLGKNNLDELRPAAMALSRSVAVGR